MSPEIIFFAKYIEKELGIVYSEFNHYQLQNRLEEIARILGLKEVKELHQLAQKSISGDLKQLLLDTATNNETSFFRDPKVFRAVQSSVFPTLLSAANATRKIRIWCAASSFGQEPYSLAMLAKEYGALSGTNVSNVEITATDISSRALERAKTGKFSQLEVQRGLSSLLLVKYFKKEPDNVWSISQELRSMISFQRLNLLESFDGLGKFDIIFCRNVLIYQNVENKIKIINKLSERLIPGGLLYLGAGESLIGLSDSYETQKADDTLYYKLSAGKVKAAA